MDTEAWGRTDLISTALPFPSLTSTSFNLLTPSGYSAEYGEGTQQTSSVYPSCKSRWKMVSCQFYI